MAVVIIVKSKNFNPDRLREELETAGLVALLTGISWAGFERATPRSYVPAAARRIVGRYVSNGVTTIDEADPGELRFSTTRDLSPAEATTLSGAVDAHDAARLSAEQGRQDQDETDLDALLATERAAFLTNLQDWDGMNSTAKMAAAKQNFQIIGKVLRLYLRQRRGAAI
jgi:hypothetical protein